MTSGYSPLGGMLVSDALMEPFADGTATFLHGITFAGHPVSTAVALANLDVFEKEDLLGNVRANEAAFCATLEKLYDLPIVGDIRGAGYFYGIELVKDKASRETFDDDESERLLRGFLSQALFDAGLVCRADDCGDPVIQLATPLTAARSTSTRWSRSCAPCSLRPGRASEPPGLIFWGGGGGGGGTQFIGWRSRLSRPAIRCSLSGVSLRGRAGEQC